MLNKDDFSKLVTSIKEKLDETSQALVSEDLLAIISNYNLAIDEITKSLESIENLTKDNEELLKVNGKLFQKIGFEKEEPKKEDDIEDKEEIKIEDVINEKGEII